MLLFGMTYEAINVIIPRIDCYIYRISLCSNSGSKGNVLHSNGCRGMSDKANVNAPTRTVHLVLLSDNGNRCVQAR